jgi:small subunit ribosomal protein S17
MADEPDNETLKTPEAPENTEDQAPEADAASEAETGVTPEAEAPAEAGAAPESDAAPEAEAPAEAGTAPEASADGATESEEATEAPAGEEQASAADAATEPVEQTEAPAPEAPAMEAPETEVPETAAPAAGASEPTEQLSSKERRRKARSTHTGEARAKRSPEERHAERLMERRKKAERRRARRLQERAKAAERRASAPAREPLAPVHAAVEGTRRVRQGIVVSDKAEKTIVVRIDIARRHRRYEKIVRSSSTLHAHDESNEAHEGDVVRVVESRPLSRTKRWKLVDVLERAR